MFSLLILLFSLASAVPLPGPHHGLAGDAPGPYQGLGSRKLPGNPSCISFTLQPNLPPETVQLVTYGAPEFSTILAMSLVGYCHTWLHLRCSANLRIWLARWSHNVAIFSWNHPHATCHPPTGSPSFSNRSNDYWKPVLMCGVPHTGLWYDI